MNRHKCIILLLILLSLKANADTSEEYYKINKLIEYTQSSDLIFIRNNKHYTSHRAAKHIKSKLKFFNIITARQFVDKVCTRSYQSNKPYYVKNGDKIITTRSWLLKYLTHIEHTDNNVSRAYAH